MNPIKVQTFGIVSNTSYYFYVHKYYSSIFTKKN